MWYTIYFTFYEILYYISWIGFKFNLRLIQICTVETQWVKLLQLINFCIFKLFQFPFTIPLGACWRKPSVNRRDLLKTFTSMLLYLFFHFWWNFWKGMGSFKNYHFSPESATCLYCGSFLLLTTIGSISKSLLNTDWMKLPNSIRDYLRCATSGGRVKISQRKPAFLLQLVFFHSLAGIFARTTPHLAGVSNVECDSGCKGPALI